MKFDSIEEKVIYNKILSYTNKTDTNNQKVGISTVSNVTEHDQFFAEIIHYIQVLENTRVNTSNRYMPKDGNKLKILIKRATRKLLRWYIEPICKQQNEFNSAITPIVGRMTEILQYQSQKNGQLEAVIEQLQQKNSAYVGEMKAIKDQMIRILDSRIYELANAANSKENTINLLIDRVKEIEINKSYITKKVGLMNEQLEKINELDIPALHEMNKSPFVKKTTSQSGEDSIIAYILMVLNVKMEKCKYVDLGANHAKELSNTYYLYSQGARGVLVEANPHMIPELKFYRNEDVILNRCVSTNSNDVIDFYVFNGDGLSTPDKNAAEEFMAKNNTLKITDIVKVETITVNEIIDTYLGEAPTLLNIDIEGKDIEILESIDFNRYRPFIIVVEMIEYMPVLVIGNKNKKILEFMINNNYIEYAFTGINSIFIDKVRLDNNYNISYGNTI